MNRETTLTCTICGKLVPRTHYKQVTCLSADCQRRQNCKAVVRWNSARNKESRRRAYMQRVARDFRCECAVIVTTEYRMGCTTSGLFGEARNQDEAREAVEG